MKTIHRSALLVLLLLAGNTVFAQRGILTVGLHFKPVIPVPFFSDISTVTQNDITAELAPKMGYSYGMVVRRGISDLFSLETGINYIQRNYDQNYTRDSLGYAHSGDIRLIGYEIPIQALVYVRLGEQTFMNAAAGVSADFFPTDVSTEDENLQLYIFRKNWVQGAVIANLGVEFRTRKKGYFYIGATYHQPLTNIAVAEFTYDEFNTPDIPVSVRTDLSGTYVTLDFRYFFYNDPNKKKKREVDRSNRDGL